jgi:hypothetical protein
MREFGLDDILSVTTGRLLSRRHMDGVYDILGYMAGGPVWTHQLPRLADVCRPEILRQHPQLADATLERELSEHQLHVWMEDQEARFGKTLPIEKLATDELRDPVDELVGMVGADRVVPVVIGDRETQADPS